MRECTRGFYLQILDLSYLDTARHLYKSTALWTSSGEEKATGVNPDSKSGVEPLRRLVVNLTTLRQLLQLSWCQMYCSALLWTTSVRPRGGSCRLGNPGSPYTLPRPAPWRGHFSAAVLSVSNNTGVGSCSCRPRQLVEVAPELDRAATAGAAILLTD